jgi:hypothetical protein
MRGRLEPGLWCIFDDTVTLTLASEWRQPLPNIAGGDTVTLEADGDTLFYAAIFSPGSRKDAKGFLRGETKFQLGSARASWDLHPIAQVPGEYTVVVNRRLMDSTLTADLLVTVRRPGFEPPSEAAIPLPPVYDLEQVPEPYTSPKDSPASYAFRLFLFLVGGAIGIAAVIGANILAWVKDGGASALPPLLAGDGTLALAVVTAWSVTSKSRFQSLEARRARRNRQRAVDPHRRAE